MALAATLAACGPAGASVASRTATPGPQLDIQRIAVLGDSISLGVNACDEPGPCSESSWIEGRVPVDSVADRIAERTGTEPEVLNASRAGARLGELSGAVDGVVESRPDLVVVLAGANDVCTSAVGTVSTTAEFGDAAAGVIGELHNDLPDAAIVVMSIPDVYGLWETLHNDPQAVRTWEATRTCRSLLADSTSTSPDDIERRDLLSAHVEDLNAVLAAECRTVSGCTYDDGLLHSMAFTPGEVSQIDFFHPSATGQAAIAGAVWDTILEADAA